MFKLDHKKLLQLGLIATLSSTTAFSAPVFLGSSEAENGNYSGEKTAIDGGMVYPRKNGSYTAYKIDTQSFKNLSYGRVPTANELKAWDTDLMPDGTGYPEGTGTAEAGDELYEAQCASCHGEFGAGGTGYPTLAGGSMDTLKNQRTKPGMDAPKRTIGTYWPQVSTLWWYIRDAMPYAHPKSLTDSEVYSITAYLLMVNEIKVNGAELEEDTPFDKKAMLSVKMPNRDGFYPKIDGPEGIENMRKFFSDFKNIGTGTRCMTDCKDPGDEGDATIMRIGSELTNVIPPYSTVRDLPPKTNKSGNSEMEELYEANCALCHKTDKMGAPAVGDKDAWKDTLKKGFDKVLQNSMSGTSSGMPPKGGNMDLTDAQVKKLVEYMINLSK